MVIVVSIFLFDLLITLFQSIAIITLQFGALGTTSRVGHGVMHAVTQMFTYHTVPERLALMLQKRLLRNTCLLPLLLLRSMFPSRKMI